MRQGTAATAPSAVAMSGIPFMMRTVAIHRSQFQEVLVIAPFPVPAATAVIGILVVVPCFRFVRGTVTNKKKKKREKYEKKSPSRLACKAHDSLSPWDPYTFWYV